MTTRAQSLWAGHQAFNLGRPVFPLQAMLGEAGEVLVKAAESRVPCFTGQQIGNCWALPGGF